MQFLARGEENGRRGGGKKKKEEKEKRERGAKKIFKMDVAAWTIGLVILLVLIAAGGGAAYLYLSKKAKREEDKKECEKLVDEGANGTCDDFGKLVCTPPYYGNTCSDECLETLVDGKCVHEDCSKTGCSDSEHCYDGSCRPYTQRGKPCDASVGNVCAPGQSCKTGRGSAGTKVCLRDEKGDGGCFADSECRSGKCEGGSGEGRCKT